MSLPKSHFQLGRHSRTPKTHRHHRPISRTTDILDNVHPLPPSPPIQLATCPLSATLRQPWWTIPEEARLYMYAFTHPSKQLRQKVRTATLRSPSHLTIHTPHTHSQSPRSTHRVLRTPPSLTHSQLPQRGHNHPQIPIRPIIQRQARI